MAARENALKVWLQNTLNQKAFTLKPLTGDASFRTYYRLECEGRSQIVMDAPPEKENCQTFINIAQILGRSGVLSPEILAQDTAQGFLLLSDLGDTLLLSQLQEKTADIYYKEAMQTLLKIQTCPADSLPAFDKAHRLTEMSLCTEWFFKKYLSLRLSNEEERLIQDTFNWLNQEIEQIPQAFIHRDYHSRNLMILPNQSLGVLDFQDAMRGPIPYDLVSLLKDCYITWPRERVLDWVQYFYIHKTTKEKYRLPDFIHDFDLCGLQRHIKVLGVFSRLFLRDNKPAYLQDLPRTLNYVLECSELYKPLHPFFDFLQNRVSLP